MKKLFENLTKKQKIATAIVAILLLSGGAITFAMTLNGNGYDEEPTEQEAVTEDSSLIINLHEDLDLQISLGEVIALDDLIESIDGNVSEIRIIGDNVVENDYNNGDEEETE